MFGLRLDAAVINTQAKVLKIAGAQVKDQEIAAAVQ